MSGGYGTGADGAADTVGNSLLTQHAPGYVCIRLRGRRSRMPSKCLPGYTQTAGFCQTVSSQFRDLVAGARREL